MALKFTRRERTTIAKSQRKLFLSVALGIVVFLALIFWGIPALINMSVFISNLSHKAETTKQTQDSSVVFPPTLQPLPEATNSAQINIKGYSSLGDNVILFVNDEQFASALTASDGAFLFSDVKLIDGKNTIWAKAVGANGKESNKSSELTIYYKKSPPKLELAGPDNNITVTGDKKFVVVSGLTDPGNMVFINDHIVVVNPDGSFSYQQSLNDKDNTIKITAQDTAGNQTTIERKVKYSSS